MGAGEEPAGIPVIEAIGLKGPATQYSREDAISLSIFSNSLFVSTSVSPCRPSNQLVAIVPRMRASSSIFLNPTKPITSIQTDSNIAITYSRVPGRIVGVARAACRTRSLKYVNGMIMQR